MAYESRSAYWVLTVHQSLHPQIWGRKALVFPDVPDYRLQSPCVALQAVQGTLPQFPAISICFMQMAERHNFLSERVALVPRVQISTTRQLCLVWKCTDLTDIISFLNINAGLVAKTNRKIELHEVIKDQEKARSWIYLSNWTSWTCKYGHQGWSHIQCCQSTVAEDELNRRLWTRPPSR